MNLFLAWNERHGVRVLKEVAKETASTRADKSNSR